MYMYDVCMYVLYVCTVCMHVSMYVCVCMNKYMYVRACVCNYACSYIGMHVCTIVYPCRSPGIQSFMDLLGIQYSTVQYTSKFCAPDSREKKQKRFEIPCFGLLSIVSFPWYDVPHQLRNKTVKCPICGRQNLGEVEGRGACSSWWRLMCSFIYWRIWSIDWLIVAHDLVTEERWRDRHIRGKHGGENWPKEEKSMKGGKRRK